MLRLQSPAARAAAGAELWRDGAVGAAVGGKLIMLYKRSVLMCSCFHAAGAAAGAELWRDGAVGAAVGGDAGAGGAAGGAAAGWQGLTTQP
jgi:hypothetical protein